MSKTTMPEKCFAPNGNAVALVRASMGKGAPQFHVIRTVKKEKGAKSFFTLAEAIKDFKMVKKHIRKNNLALKQESIQGYKHFQEYMIGGKWGGEVRAAKTKVPPTPTNII